MGNPMSNTTLINASKIIVQMALKTIVPTALQIVVQIIVQITLVDHGGLWRTLVDPVDPGGPRGSEN